MEYRPAATLAVGVYQVGDRHVEARRPQRFDHEIALPGAVGRKLPVLHGATAAYTEMWADRSDALGARPVDVQESATIRMSGNGVDLDRLAGQRAGHIDRAVGAWGNAIAAMAELVDHEAFSHVAPR